MLRTYDDWKTASPTDDMPNADEGEVETCEHCGHAVKPVDPAWCRGCHRYSDRNKRPEHEEETHGSER